MDTTEQQMREAGFETEDGRNWKRGDYMVAVEVGPTQVGPDGFFAALAWRAAYKNAAVYLRSWEADIALPSPVAAYAHAEIAVWGGKPAEDAARMFAGVAAASLAFKNTFLG